MPHDVPRTFPSLLSALAARPTPVLTWYGRGGDRVDLSGRVAANWMTKAANRLILELSAGAGTTVALDLPAHWRSLVWAHAVWAAGAELDLGGTDVDIAVRRDPAEATAAQNAVEITANDEIFVPLPALARRVRDLPAGGVDGAADLMTQPDAWIVPPAHDPAAPTGLGLSQAELLAAPVELRELDPGSGPGDAAPRVLLGAEVALARALEVVPSLWARGASVVGIGEGGPAPADLVTAEAITHVLAK